MSASVWSNDGIPISTLDIPDFNPDDPAWVELPDSEGVTVTGTSPAGPLTVNPAEELDREAIEESGSGDLGELLQNEAGVAIQKTGGYGTVSTLSQGGFSGSRVAVYVDGVPVNSPQNGSFDPADLDLASVETVTVQELGEPGSGSASGLPGGSVSITTAGPVQQGFRLSGSLSNRAYLSSTMPDAFFTSPLDTQTYGIHGEMGLETLSAKLGAWAVNAQNRYGWTDSNSDEHIRADNEVMDGGGSGSLFITLSPFTTVAASFSARAGDKDIPGSINYNTPGNQKDARTIESLRLDTTRLARDDLAGSLTAGHTRSWILWTDYTGESEHTSDLATLTGTLDWYASPSVTANFSAGGEYTGIQSTQNGGHSGFGGGASAVLNWQPEKNAIIAPGLSLASDGERAVPVPRLGLALETDKGYRLTGNLFRLYRFPSFNELYWSGDPSASGNPDLSSEEGWGADAGISRTEENWSLSWTNRFTWYRNAIIWSAESGIWRPENAGEAWYVSSATVFGGKIGETSEIKLRYDWLFTRVVTGDLEFADGKYMPYQPVHTLQAGFTKHSGDALLNLTARYISERYTGILNLTALPPCFLLDISAQMPVAPGLELSLELRNAFGASYEITEGYPMPGTSLTAGLEFLIGLQD